MRTAQHTRPSRIAVATRSEPGRPAGTTFNSPSRRTRNARGSLRAVNCVTNAVVDLNLHYSKIKQCNRKSPHEMLTQGILAPPSPADPIYHLQESYCLGHHARHVHLNCGPRQMRTGMGGRRRGACGESCRETTCRIWNRFAGGALLVERAVIRERYILGYI
jgi:hypothetical protein